MNIQKHSPKSSPKKARQIPEERDPISDIRFPLMLLFLMAATATFILELPSWVALAAGSSFAAVWALIRERRLLIALATSWRTPWLFIAPVMAMFIYALLDLLMQSMTSTLIESGNVANDKEVPTLFLLLLSLRSAAGELPPILLGLGGGVLLGVGEEFFWRGFVQTRLMLFTSHGMAALATSLLYGVFYFFALGALGALLGIFLGIVLSLFTLRSRSLLPAMVCHSTFLIVALWLQPDISQFF